MPRGQISPHNDSKSMRIALYHHLPSGGAKRHTFEQVKRLVKRGHRVFEFAPSTADLDYASLTPHVAGTEVFQVEPPKLLRRRIPMMTPYLHAFQGLRALKRMEAVDRVIADAIDLKEFDVVLAKDCRVVANPYALRFLGSRVVFQCHHGLRHKKQAGVDGKSAGVLGRVKHAYYRPARYLFERKFGQDELENIQHADRVLTNSEFSETLLQDHYGLSAEHIYPGIDTQVFRPKNIEEGDYVLSVGALVYSKGHRFLVEALARMEPQKRPRLFIAANSRDPNEERLLRSMAAEAGVDLEVDTIFDDERLVGIYNRALAFVYAPIGEALGMAPLEAMACGRPVVAVAEGGVRETVGSGSPGMTTARDSADFAAQLQALLADDAQRQKLGEAGVEYVRRSWTWDRAVDSLEQVLIEVAASEKVADL